MVHSTPPQKISRLPQNSHPPASAAARWQAVVNRDATATTFVYAVITTKIYCRPSCPSRLARRANVQFYDTPSQAEAAGFRACKRCKPESLQALVNPQVRLVHQACLTIKSDVAAGLKPTLLKIACEAGLTPSHFHRVFKKVMGVTPGKYAAGALGGGGGGGGGGQIVENHLERTGQDESGSLAQPCGEDASLDPSLLDGLDLIGAFSAGDVALWNDFDALIAAEEAEYMVMPEACPLIEDFNLLSSGSSDSLEVAAQDELFVDGLARADG